MSHITLDPEILSGTPCFAGTRVPVKNLFDYLAHNHPLDDFLEDFPTVSREQVLAVLDLAKQGRPRGMKLLLDECLPARLRNHISGHLVSTVPHEGWAGIKNGQLLARAAAAGFDALITVDAGIEHQQDAGTLPLAIVILHAPSNAIDDLAKLAPALIAALATLSPMAVTHVG